jgi:hypothetical protein
MDSNRSFVGAVKVKPVLQEVVKTTAGGMIAVSSAIIFYWMQEADKPITFNVLVMLWMHAFAIPLLAAARVSYALLDNYERISESADRYFSRLIEFGFGFAFSGYIFQICLFSLTLGMVFALGVGVAVYQVVRFTHCLGDPHMVRRPERSN